MPPPDRLAMNIVVTGSTRGIGREIARELLADGARVLVHGRDPARIDQAVAALAPSALAADAALGLAADLADPAACDAFVDAAAARLGPIDAWIHNAGADTLTGPAATMSFDDKLDLLWRVDVQAAIRCCRAVGRHMVARGSGVILTIGWDQAEQGMAGDSGELFAAVKGAVMAFTRSLAQSLAPAVRVNCLAPGWIRTAWGESASDYWNRRARAESLVDRWGEPTDIARAARFLVSPAASFITGQVLRVNGGFRYGQSV
jgi:3-oxoacyl-[acyl-carrier protein] reductase